MRVKDAVLFATANLMKNPMRTLLTILGLGVGVAAVLTVITLGAAGQVQVENEIAKLGVDKVWVHAEQGSDSTLSNQSAQKITKAVGTQASGTSSRAAAVIFGNAAQIATVTGYDEAYRQVLAPTLQAGRFFTQRELTEGATVALIDETLAEAFRTDMPGARITLGSRMFTVVGVMKPAAVQAGTGMVAIPLKSLQDTYQDVQVTEVTVSIPEGQSADAVAAMAQEALGDGFQTMTLQEEIEAARSVIRIFVLVLASVAVVCMVTGGIGVMNILLVSVRERRGEIGLMKAVGGTSRQIAGLFLLEAVDYAVLGGLLGLLMGVAMIRLFGKMIGLDASLTVSTALPSLAGAAVLGLVFGVVPAIKASAMMPADALRRE